MSTSGLVWPAPNGVQKCASNRNLKRGVAQRTHAHAQRRHVLVVVRSPANWTSPQTSHRLSCGRSHRTRMPPMLPEIQVSQPMATRAPCEVLLWPRARRCEGRLRRRRRPNAAADSGGFLRTQMRACFTLDNLRLIFLAERYFSSHLNCAQAQWSHALANRAYLAAS